jgi:hypothetical protein
VVLKTVKVVLYVAELLKIHQYLLVEALPFFIHFVDY